MDALIVLYAGNQIDTLIWDCGSLDPFNPRHEFRLPEDPDSRAEITKELRQAEHFSDQKS